MKRTLTVLSVMSLTAVAACGGGEAEMDDGMEATVQDTFVTQDTALAPVVAPVVTEDTGIVETTVERDVDVDVDTDTIVEP